MILFLLYSTFSFGAETLSPCGQTVDEFNKELVQGIWCLDPNAICAQNSPCVKTAQYSSEGVFIEIDSGISIETFYDNYEKVE